jgi:hypothetical protein
MSNHRILQNITEYYRISQNITEYYRISQNITEYHRIILGNYYSQVLYCNNKDPVLMSFVTVYDI